MRYRLRTLLILIVLMAGDAAGQQPPIPRRGYDDIDRLDERLPKLIELARQEAEAAKKADETARRDAERRAIEIPFGIPGLRFPINIERAMQIDCVPPSYSST